MISLLTAGVLFCSGFTQSYDVYVYVDPNAKTVTGALADPDGFKSSRGVKFSDLQLKYNCLVSEQVELCFGDRGVSLRIPSLATPESGVLSCRPTSR